MLAFIRKNKPYPHYFRTGGIFVQVTGRNFYLKSFVSRDGTHFETRNETYETTDKLFGKPWRSISEKKWLRHLDLCHARATGKNEKPVKFAFEVGGIEYFTYENTFDFPAGRFRDMDIINIENAARMTFDEIIESFRKIIGYVDHKSGVLVSGITSEAKMSIARMTLTTRFDLWEKLATTMYFDAAEDISTYDPGYNEKKIAHWRAHQEDFFLKISKEPVRRLLPFEGNSQESLQNFLKEQKAKLMLIQAGMIVDASDTSKE